MKAEQKPILDGHKVHKVVVNGDHRRWSMFLPADVWWGDAVNLKLWPCRRGKWLIEYILLPFSPTDNFGSLLAEVDRRNLRLPDRATVETILDELTYEPRAVNIAGICSVWSYKNKYPMATSISLMPNGARHACAMHYMDDRQCVVTHLIAVVRRRRVRIQVRLL